MTGREYVVVPVSILDELWSRPVPFWRLTQNKRLYIDHLDRYVDMGVLSKTGAGTKDDPYRYAWELVAHQQTELELVFESRRFLRGRGIDAAEFRRGVVALRLAGDN